MQDLKYNHSRLINSLEQHLYIANFEWYHDLKEFTPESWTDQNFYQCDSDIELVVKGKTNSRKNRWNKSMWAKNKKDALYIASELSNDGLICDQGIIYRRYEPLKTFEIGLHGLPFSNEWRFFCLKDKILEYGYYWSICDKAETIHKEEPDLDNGKKLIKQLTNILKDKLNFYVLDIAQKENGDWILIEINDAQMCGLSMCDPDKLYSNLKQELDLSCEDFLV